MVTAMDATTVTLGGTGEDGKTLLIVTKWVDIEELERLVKNAQRIIDTHHAQSWADHLEGDQNA
jgi:hypothetical protein